LAVIKVILVNFKIFLVGNRVDLEKIEKTWPLRMVITDNYRVKNSGKERIKKISVIIIESRH